MLERDCTTCSGHGNYFKLGSQHNWMGHLWPFDPTKKLHFDNKWDIYRSSTIMRQMDMDMIWNWHDIIMHVWQLVRSGYRTCEKWPCNTHLRYFLDDYKVCHPEMRVLHGALETMACMPKTNTTYHNHIFEGSQMSDNWLVGHIYMKLQVKTRNTITLLGNMVLEHTSHLTQGIISTRHHWQESYTIYDNYKLHWVMC